MPRIFKFFKRSKQNPSLTYDTVEKGVVDAAYQNITVYQGVKEKRSYRKTVTPHWFWRAPYGVPRKVNIYEIREMAQTAWCRICIDTLIDEVCSVEWDIVPKDPKHVNNPIVLEHCRIVKRFFENPNINDESFEQILRQVVRDILEIDAGVIVKVFDEKGQLREIYAADGATFLKKVDEHGVVQGYYQYSFKNPQSKPIFFTEKEIVYIMQNPRSYSCYGFSPVQSILTVVKTLIKSLEWNEKYFSESIPSGVLSLLDISETEFENFIRWWETEVKGKPHKLPIINRDFKWQQFTLTNKEMQFLESQRWYFKLVMAAFKVTPNELGLTETVNRATSEEQSEVFRRKGLGPLLRLLEYHINTEIIPEFGFDDVMFKFAPHRDRFEKERQIAIWEREIRTGLKTINEVRREMGLDPVPWGNRPLFMPQNYPFESVTGTQPSIPPITLANKKALTTDNPIIPSENTETNVTPVTHRDEFYKLPNPSSDPRDPREIWGLKTFEKKFTEDLQKLFKKHVNELINFLKSEKFAEAMKQLNGKPLLEKDVKVFRDLIEKVLSGHAQEFKEFLKKYMLNAILLGFRKAAQELNLEATFDLEDPLAVHYIETYTQLLATSKYEQVRDRIRNVLIEGLQTGLSIDKMGELIKEEFSTLTDWEAERIARTETIRASNMGRLIGYQKSDVVEGKQWIVTYDDRTCPDCLEMANQKVPLLSKFISPRFGQIDVPPLHPNCRCTIVPVISKNAILTEDGRYIKKTKTMIELEQKYNINIYDYLREKYSSGLSTRKIADELGVTHFAVYSWLKLFGLIKNGGKK